MARNRFRLLIAVLSLAVAPLARADGGPIMPLSQVRAGTDCIGETVVHGTEIDPFSVHVVEVIEDPSDGPRILVTVSGSAVDSTGIAEGFSGSPVLCPTGSGLANIGAISEGVGDYGGHVALVTPIEQMLKLPVTPPTGARPVKLTTRELSGPLTVGGVSPAILRLLQAAAAKAGRQVIAAPSTGFSSYPIQALVPGASVAMSYSTGAVPMGAVGTVTYRDGATLYAFGHPLDDVGRRSLLLQDAYVFRVIGNPEPATPSYKLASPGHTEGTFSNDAPDAVLGRVGPPPMMIPVTVTAHDLDTGHVVREQTQVADETDVGLPLGSSLLELITPLAVAQGATDIYDGAPANESGRLCIRVTLRESHVPLGFCNHYAGTGIPGDLGAVPELAALASTDTGTALGLLDAQQFAQLHPTGVTAVVYAQRGLVTATIVSARAPSHVRAGATVPIRVLVRPYRAPLQTISFPLRIPRAVNGVLRVKITGAPATGSSGGASQGLAGLTAILAGQGGTQTGPVPTSMASLRRLFSRVGSYDGLTARFAGRAKRVYRNPDVLITGRARVAIAIKR